MSKVEHDEKVARRALETLLQGNSLPEDELQALIAQDKEHTYLDFKSGKTKRDKVRDVVREYVAAFANGDGGILCIGPADKNDPTTGRRPCYPLDAPSTIPVDDWLKEHLGELLPFLSPLPRIIQQRYHAGSEEVDVVFIAVARAPGLVPLYDKAKRPTWWVRFRDSNRQIPEYLAADIILGRRNAPTLALRDPRLFAGRLIHNSAQERSGELKISVTVDNLGFVAAENDHRRTLERLHFERPEIAIRSS